MNKYLYTRLMREKLLFVILLIYCHIGMVYADINKNFTDNHQKILLNSQQIRALDTLVIKELPACGFVFKETPISTMTADKIFECVYVLHYWLGAKIEATRLVTNQGVTSIRILDDYLGSRILPYALSIPKIEQGKLLRWIAAGDADNLIFISAMISRGAPVQDILIQNIKEGGGEVGSCTFYMPFFTKNIALYQNEKTLYTEISNSNNPYWEDASRFRWMDLHYLADTTLRTNKCYDIIKKLAKLNFELLNKKHIDDNGTPLHYFLRDLNIRSLADIEIIKILTSRININMQTKHGNTPLHEFLMRRNKSAQDKHIVKWLIEKGANINIKDNQGITVRELILKNPDFFGFLK